MRLLSCLAISATLLLHAHAKRERGGGSGGHGGSGGGGGGGSGRRGRAREVSWDDDITPRNTEEFMLPAHLRHLVADNPYTGVNAYATATGDR